MVNPINYNNGCPTQEHRALMEEVRSEFCRLHIHVCKMIKHHLQANYDEEEDEEDDFYVGDDWDWVSWRLYEAIETRVSPDELDLGDLHGKYGQWLEDWWWDEFGGDGLIEDKSLPDELRRIYNRPLLTFRIKSLRFLN